MLGCLFNVVRTVEFIAANLYSSKHYFNVGFIIDIVQMTFSVPQVSKNNYMEGNKSTICNDSHADAIPDSSTCKTAAQHLGRMYERTVLKHDFPSGCYIYLKHGIFYGNVFFNKHSNDKRHGLISPICVPGM